MATIKAVLNKDRIKKHGDYSLVIQILHKRVKRVIYTPCKLKEDEFDPITQKARYTNGVRYTHKQIKEINYLIEQKKNEITSIVDYLSMRDTDFTVADILKKYHFGQNDKYLATYIERLIDRKEAQGKMGSAKSFLSTLRSLQRFMGTREVEFKEIDHHFVKRYEEFLLGTNIKQNTVGFYLRNFRTIYNMAFDQGIEMNDHSAFGKIKIKVTKTVKRALKQEVIEKISLMDLSENHELDKARDLFMFSFYTRGMSFVDIIHLQHSDIVDGVIYYRRHKTNQSLQVAVTEPLRRIIDKYNTDPTYVLPFINQNNQPTLYKRYQASYGCIYRSLRVLQKQLNLNTPLTTYVARHSWATIAKEQGASTSVISEGLGHSSENTTRIYLKEFDRSVIDRVNEKIVSFSTVQCTAL